MTTPYPTVIAPDIEALAVAFLTPLMNPTPVASRLPDPLDRNDTTLGFLRVEAAGGYLDREGAFFTLDVILHSYSPNEVLATQIIGKAVAPRTPRARPSPATAKIGTSPTVGWRRWRRSRPTRALP